MCEGMDACLRTLCTDHGQGGYVVSCPSAGRPEPRHQALTLGLTKTGHSQHVDTALAKHSPETRPGYSHVQSLDEPQGGEVRTIQNEEGMERRQSTSNLHISGQPSAAGPWPLSSPAAW